MIKGIKINRAINDIVGYQQLTLDIVEKLNYDFDNFDWLIGNPDNLKIFFKEQLTKDISQKLKDDALRRLKVLQINNYN